ncbi:hypothetical protein [Serinibacter salmoneus]|uniref:OCRE domain-containing protein n=1 Tax=Serinibacter salmoneus TaxID=556530 RepID=A0A2A9D576_9MICO|nr:hypothetical protein [Serinibacter salmoneus]PFG21010.1 hypothetical protein ATL40_2629 [Serinibacter salmoneus]
MIDADRTLVETTAAHRERMVRVLTRPPRGPRRRFRSNVGRLMGSVVLAAVICCACLGTGFVLGLLERQRHTEAVAAFQAALAANPIQPGDGLLEEEGTAFLLDEDSGEYIDPRTGFPVDPETGYATDPQGRLLDTRLGWYVDPLTGWYTDPTSGVTLDPQTLTVVEDP